MRQISVFLILSLILSGCTRYHSQYIPFKPPEGYGNHTLINGVAVGGEAYPGKKQAEHAFGFDIRATGLLPVMLVLDNKSGQTVEIVGSQCFLIDNSGFYWPVVTNEVAFQRLEQSTQFASYVGSGAGKGAVLGAAIGGLLATALGIVSGQSVATWLGKGAALGGAGGAVIGGIHEGSSSSREIQISNDLRDKGLEGKLIPDQYLANGFLFFPGEAKSAKELRLQWKERDTGAAHTVTLPLAGQTGS